MPDGFFHAEAKPSWAKVANLRRHILGELRHATARPVPEPVEVYADDREGALQALRDAQARRKGKRGAKPFEVVDFVFTGPPSYGEPGEWDRARETEWAQACYAWIRGVLGPRAPIVAAAVHRDEKSPHLHVLAVPIGPDRELGWTAIERAAVEARGAKWGKRGVGYQALQNAFYAEVSARFGLGRGKPGSKRKQAPIDRQKAAEHAADLAKRKADLAEREAEATRAAAADDVAKLRAGDEAIAASLGVPWTPKARRGREERERLERAARDAKGEADRAKGEAEGAQAEAERERAKGQLRADDYARAKRERDDARERAASAERTVAELRRERDADLQRSGEKMLEQEQRHARELAEVRREYAGGERGKRGRGVGG